MFIKKIRLWNASLDTVWWRFSTWEQTEEHTPCIQQRSKEPVECDDLDRRISQSNRFKCICDCFERVSKTNASLFFGDRKAGPFIRPFISNICPPAAFVRIESMCGHTVRRPQSLFNKLQIDCAVDFFLWKVFIENEWESSKVDLSLIFWIFNHQLALKSERVSWDCREFRSNSVSVQTSSNVVRIATETK